MQNAHVQYPDTKITNKNSQLATRLFIGLQPKKAAIHEMEWMIGAWIGSICISINDIDVAHNECTIQYSDYVLKFILTAGSVLVARSKSAFILVDQFVNTFGCNKYSVLYSRSLFTEM